MAGKSLSPLGGSGREEVNTPLVFCCLQAAVVPLLIPGSRERPFCSQDSCKDAVQDPTAGLSCLGKESTNEINQSMQTAPCNLHAGPSLLELVSASCCLIDSVRLCSFSVPEGFSTKFSTYYHCELRYYFRSFKSIAKLYFLVQPRSYIKRSGEQSVSTPDFYLPLHINPSCILQTTET